MILPEDENFLLIFRREAPLDNSVDFMKVRSDHTKHQQGEFPFIVPRQGHLDYTMRWNRTTKEKAY